MALTGYYSASPGYEQCEHRLLTFEQQLLETGQATAYIFANGQFREITVTPEPDEGPLSDEEVSSMLTTMN